MLYRENFMACVYGAFLFIIGEQERILDCHNNSYP